MRARRRAWAASLGGMVVLLLASPVASTTAALAAPRTVTPSPEAAARALSRRMLASLVLPPGARKVASLPAVLDQPYQSLLDIQRVDFIERYEVAGTTPRSVLAFFEHHAPAGTVRNGEGTGDTGGRASEWGVTFSPLRLSAAIYQAQLDVTIARVAVDVLGLRADGVVVWQEPHPHAEAVPPGVGSAVASAHLFDKLRRSLLLRRGAALSDLVRTFDAMPVAPPGAIFCPADFGLTVGIVFARTAISPPISLSEGDCGLAKVTVGGEAAPTLRDPGDRLATMLSSILGYHGEAVWHPGG